MNKNLNGWAISEELHQWIINNLDNGKTILELGSGTGTIELCKRYKVYSIEHNGQYLNIAKDSNYIYAPIKDGWYSIESLSELNNIKYDLILVDGPPGNIGRDGFLHNLNLFNTNVPIIFDDTNRKAELDLAQKVSEKLNKPMKHFGGVEKSFIII